MRRLALWFTVAEDRQKRDLDVPLWLVQDRTGRFIPVGVEHAACVRITPAGDSPCPIIAQVLVPATVVGQVVLNGQELPEGTHFLRHADLVELGDDPFWVAVDCDPDETVYDSAVHPAEWTCGLAGTVLCPGDSLVICPGTAVATCGALYRRDAWESARKTLKSFHCPLCGYTPGRGHWAPPAPPSARSLPRLFQVVTRASRRHDMESRVKP
ncbi:MAG: hypothetical protein JW719_04925 [Pirellulales bacterium]|nr:hypothetical protein [Pirellulales bacterium]